MDAAILNLLVTIFAIISTIFFRKRILAALGVLLIAGAERHLRASLFEETDETTPEGLRRVSVRLRPRGEALLAAVVPPLMAAVVKNLKLKPGAGPSVPPGLNLGELDASMVLQLLPKKYQGIAAIGLPILQGFLGGKGMPGASKQKGTPLEELDRGVSR